MWLIGVCASALAGIVIGDICRLEPSRLEFVAAVSGAGACCAWKLAAWRALALVVCAAALGALRAVSAGAVSAGDVHVLGLLLESDFGNWLAVVRTAAQAAIHHHLPEPQASLAAGVLLGGSGQLDAQFRLNLQRSGLGHLLAIDGFKQVVVAGAIGAVSVRLLGARLAALPTLVTVGWYTLLTGAHPSAVRAGLMVGLATLASLTGRVSDSLTSLLVAVVVMAAVEPRVMLDVGLQLSLSATLGIVLLWPRLRRHFPRRLPRLVAEPVGLTLAVTIATLPVTLSVFQMISLVSPVAHVMAVPLLPAVLVSTAVLAAASWVEPLAAPVAWLVWLPSSLLAFVIEFFGGLPGAALTTGRLPLPAMIGLSVLLLGWGAWGLPELHSIRRECARWRARRGSWSLPCAGAAACLVACAVLVFLKPDGQLHVDFLDLGVGRGEAVFIRGPTGRTALVVTGRVDARLLVGQVADRLAVWEHKLDYAVALDPRAERSLSLTLARYPADQLFDAQRDVRIDLGGGAALEIYAADGRAWLTSGQTTFAAIPGSGG